jgi:hypothetical protein
MIEVTFRFPDELDLAFLYLNRQFQRFIDEDIMLPQHEISIGETEMSILLWYPDDEDTDGNNDDDDPLWPIKPPEPPGPTSMTSYLPTFNTYYL